MSDTNGLDPAKTNGDALENQDGPWILEDSLGQEPASDPDPTSQQAGDVPEVDQLNAAPVSEAAPLPDSSTPGGEVASEKRGCGNGALGVGLSFVAIVLSLIALKQVSDLQVQLAAAPSAMATAAIEPLLSNVSSDYSVTTDDEVPLLAPSPAPVFERMAGACQGAIRVMTTDLRPNVGDATTVIVTLSQNDPVNVTAESRQDSTWLRIYINHDVYGWIPKAHVTLPSGCTLAKL